MPPRRSSEATKNAIRTAARELFAATGYERTTIRAVAAAAAIDPSMVMRYFGSKEGLLVAAADFDLRLPDLSGAPRDEIGALLAEHFLDRWERDDAFTALLHAASTHEVARERLVDVVHGPELAAVVARHVDDPDAVPARVGLIAGQILGTALCRYVLHLPSVVDMPRDELVRWLGGTLQRYLTDGRTLDPGNA